MKDITTEEAIQIMRNHICWIENKTVKQAIVKVLNELNSKKGIINALNIVLKERTDERDKKDEIINKKDKIIDAMTDQLVGLTIWDDKKQEPVMLMTEEEVRKFFEEEVKNE